MPEHPDSPTPPENLHQAVAAMELHVEHGHDGEWRIVTAWQNTDRPF